MCQSSRVLFCYVSSKVRKASRGQNHFFIARESVLHIEVCAECVAYFTFFLTCKMCQEKGARVTVGHLSSSRSDVLKLSSRASIDHRVFSSVFSFRLMQSIAQSIACEILPVIWFNLTSVSCHV